MNEKIVQYEVVDLTSSFSTMSSNLTGFMNDWILIFRTLQVHYVELEHKQVFKIHEMELDDEKIDCLM